VQYLAGYLDSEVPLPDYSLDAVLKAAGKIEEMLRGEFRPKTKKVAPVSQATAEENNMKGPN
jgi:hypothetical protein